MGDQIVGSRPNVDHLVVLLAMSHQTGRILRLDFCDFGLRIMDDRVLLLGNDKVIHTDGCTRRGGVGKTRVHQLVGENYRIFQADISITGIDQVRYFFLIERLVDHLEGKGRGQDFRQERTPYSGIHQVTFNRHRAILCDNVLFHSNFDPRLQFGLTRIIGPVHFLDIGKHTALALSVHLLTGHVVKPEHHVLGWNDDWLAAGRRQNVVGRHHQRPAFKLSFKGKRHVNGHLVAVEVRVVGRTYQRVQLNGLAFNKHRFERLNAETVQRRCAIQQHWMLANHLGKNVPHLGCLAFHHLLGGFYCRRKTARFQLSEDEWLEQFQGHLLWQAALMQPQRWSHHDHRTTRVVDPLPEQVLTETPLFPFDHVG